jgi:hypothetical protein
MPETESKVQVKVVEKRLPEYYAVIHRPKLDQPQRMGHLIFAYPKENEFEFVNNNVQTQVLMGVLTLKEGCTFVDYAIWQAAMSFPQNQKEVERMQGVGAIAIFTPNAEITSRDSTDFTTIGAAVSVIGFCNDLSWLEKSRNRDKRLEIDKAIAARLEQVAEKTKNPQQSFPVGSFI